MPVLSRQWHLSENSYFLASPNGFFYRYCGNGFQNKWTGLWDNETKHVEYFAAKAGDDWLSENNTHTMNYNGSLAEHVYEITGGLATELLGFHPERNELLLLYELPDVRTLELELAIDIRLRHENNTNRAHAWNQKGHTIEIANAIGKTWITVFSGDLQKTGQAFQKNHAPGGELQTCSVNKLFLRGKTIGLSIRTTPRGVKNISDALKALEQKHTAYQALEDHLLESDNQTLEHAIRWSRIGIELLTQKRGKHTIYCAGYPWFTQGWGRDTFWALYGLVDLDMIKQAENQIEMYANAQRDGRIANFLPDTYNSIDATLLWLIAVAYTARRNGNAKWLKKLAPKITAALEFLKKNTRNGLLVHDAGSHDTWMDTLPRPQTGIDVQSLFVEALTQTKRNWKWMSAKPFAYENERIDAENQLQKHFAKTPFPPDRMINVQTFEMDNVQTANPVLPLLFGQFPEKTAELTLNRLESSDFSNQTGLRSRAHGQPNYDPAGYHTGRVWSLTTAWLAMAEYRLGRSENAYRTLESFFMELERNNLGGIAETFHGETGQSNGAELQLWGQALLAHIIDAHLLGIEIDALEKKVRFHPQLPQDTELVRRIKKIDSKNVVFSAERDHLTGKTECHVEGLPKKYKLESGIIEKKK